MKLRKRLQQRAGRIWQYRYWDHVIRDQKDLNTHIDYIHYNPVKHALARNPFNWKYSSIAEYKDVYSNDWGVKEVVIDRGNFGE